MVTIKRVINGLEVEIQLTEEEIAEVHRHDNIQWAKSILANYAETIVGYDKIINDDDQLVAFAELLEEKNLENNGDREIEAVEELFGLVRD